MGVTIAPLQEVEEQEQVDAALAFYQALRQGKAQMRADQTAQPDQE